MKGLVPLLLGIFGTFAFSWAGLILIPNMQIGQLTPQSDEEGSDIYPMPRSGMVERGRHVYAANGCAYCHSVWIRPEYAANDLERDRDYAAKVPWGVRRSAPRDYIFDRPVLLGKERMGPDLANMGKAAPSEEESAPGASQTPAKLGQQPYTAAWHHRHLYSPRSFNIDSNMPAYRFLYQRRPVGSERSADALELTGGDAPPAGWEIVPTFDAQCLVAYLMSLDQSHPLSEVKSGAPAAAPAGSPAAPGGSPAAPAGSPTAPGASPKSSPPAKK